MTYKVIQTKYPINDYGGSGNCSITLEQTAKINKAYKTLEDMVSKWSQYEFVIRGEVEK